MSFWLTDSQSTLTYSHLLLLSFQLTWDPAGTRFSLFSLPCISSFTHFFSERVISAIAESCQLFSIACCISVVALRRRSSRSWQFNNISVTTFKLSTPVSLTRLKKRWIREAVCISLYICVVVFLCIQHSQPFVGLGAHLGNVDFSINLTHRWSNRFSK